MTKAVLFFDQDCPDTAPFVAELKRLGIEYEEVAILSSLANFKRFLRLRDHESVFDQARQQGYIGIPALLLPNGNVILDIKLLAEQ